MLEESEFETRAERVVRWAGLDPFDVVDAMQLARRLVGCVRQFPGTGLPGDAVLVRVNCERRIYVRASLQPRRLRWAVLHECAEAILQDDGYSDADVEIASDRLAASLGVPKPAATSACKQAGAHWTQLAFAFGSSESSAALRYGEVTRRPILLSTPIQIRTRGEPSPWPSDRELRTADPIKGIRKAYLRDDPRRLVARRIA